MRRGWTTGCSVVSQQIPLVEPDCARVLPYIAGIVDAAWKTIKVAVLNRVELPGTQLGGRSYGFKADALRLPPTPYTENACFRHDVCPGTALRAAALNRIKSGLSCFYAFSRRIQDSLLAYNFWLAS
jgi:hypothetical protein